MMKDLMQQNVVSNSSLAHGGSLACSLAAAAVLLLGFRQLEHLELSKAQLYLATLGTLGLATTFVILALLLHMWRRQLAAHSELGRSA